MKAGTATQTDAGERTSPSMPPGAAPLATALGLQHTRCALYRLWDDKFHRALAGSLPAAEFQAAVGQTIVGGFQRVSAALRELQDGVRAGADGGGDAAQFLDGWIEKVQCLEQEHYRVSVLLAQSIAEHCAAVPLSQHDTADATATAATTSSSSLVLSVRPNDGEGDKGNGESTAAPTGTCGPRASLHDAEHCVLKRLIPVSSQAPLMYVSCLDAAWLSPDDAEKTGEEKTEQGERSRQENNVHEVSSDDDDERVSLILRTGDKASYLPREVQRRCMAFNTTALPLWREKRRLMQQLQEWTEELQAELASVAA